MRSSSMAAIGGLAVLPALIVLMLVALDSPIVLAQSQPTDPNANVAKKAPPPGSRKSAGWSQERIVTAQAHADPAGRSEHDQEERAGPAGPCGKRAIRAIPVRAVPGSRAMSPACR